MTERSEGAPGGDEDGLGVVLEARGREFAARAVHVSVTEAELSFERAPLPALPVGELAALRFRAPRLRRPVVVRARVVWRVEGDRTREYGFELDQSTADDRASAALFELFNRRRDYRVHWAAEDRFGILMTALGPERSQSPAWLKNLSASGVGVLASPNTDVAFAAVERVQTSFLIPQTNEPITLVARIRHRRRDQDQLRYGLEFDAGSASFERQRERIVAYVEEAQRRAIGGDAR